MSSSVLHSYGSSMSFGQILLRLLASSIYNVYFPHIRNSKKYLVAKWNHEFQYINNYPTIQLTIETGEKKVVFWIFQNEDRHKFSLLFPPYADITMHKFFECFQLGSIQYDTQDYVNRPNLIKFETRIDCSKQGICQSKIYWQNLV